MSKKGASRPRLIALSHSRRPEVALSFEAWTEQEMAHLYSGYSLAKLGDLSRLNVVFPNGYSLLDGQSLSDVLLGTGLAAHGWGAVTVAVALGP